MGKISLLRFLYLVTLLSLACYVCLACTPLLLPGAKKTAVPVPSPPFSTASPIPARASPSPTPNPLNEIVAPLKSQDLEGLHYAGPFLLERLNQPVQIQFRHWNYPENSYPASLFEFSSSHPDEIAVNALGQVTALKDAGQSRITVKAKGQNWKEEFLLSVNQLDSDGSRYQTWRVNQDSAYHHKRDAQIVQDEQGNSLIIWSHSLKNPDNSLYPAHYQTMGQRFTPQGLPLGSAFAIGKPLDFVDSQQWPEIALKANGDFVLVWFSNSFSLYGQQFNAKGQALGDAFLINQGATGSFGQTAQVGLSDSGDFTVVWGGNTYEPEIPSLSPFKKNLYFRQYTANGQPKGPEQKTQLPFSFTPRMVVHTSGQFILLSDHLWAQVFSVQGQPTCPMFKINTTPFVKNQSPPELGMDLEGNWIVAWSSFLETDQTRLISSSAEHLLKIFARKFSLQGSPLSEEIAVSPASSKLERTYDNLGLSVSQKGDFSIAWSESFPKRRLFSLRSYSKSLIPMEEEKHFSFYYGGDSPPQIQLLHTQNNYAVLVWEARYNSYLDIFARRIQLTSTSSKN